MKKNGYNILRQVKKPKGKSPEDLRELWVKMNKGATDEDIALEYDVTLQTVKNWKQKLRRAGYGVRYKPRRKQLSHISTTIDEVVDDQTIIINEWDDATIADFLSDFMGIDIHDAENSVFDRTNDILLRFAADGIPVKEAEKMILGVDWYLRELVKGIKRQML